MGKLFVTKGFLKGLPDVSTLDHTKVIMDHQVGFGGGKHLIRDIWDSTLDNIKDQNKMAPFVNAMLKCFQTHNKNIVIRNYRIEHRVYVLDEEKFIGKIHDDSCEYSIILYYRIDDQIQGGELNFYDDDGETILDVHKPNVGDLVILNGVHAVGEMYTKSEATRSILIVQINSED